MCVSDPPPGRKEGRKERRKERRGRIPRRQRPRGKFGLEGGSCERRAASAELRAPLMSRMQRRHAKSRHQREERGGAFRKSDEGR